MAANPFFVDPTMGAEAIPQQLAGISSILSENRLRNQAMQEQKDAEAKALARQQAVQQAAVQAFESKDPDVMARTALEFPEVTEMLKGATGIQDEQKNRDALGFTRAFALADNTARPALYERRIQELQAQGRDPSDTIASYEDFKANPDAEVRDVLSYWAGIDPKGYGVYSDERKAEQAAALAAQKLAAEESRFVRGEAGKNSRAAMSAADRSITRDIAMLTAKQNAEMNDLKREELGVKIAEKQAKLDKSKFDTQKAIDSANANLDASIKAADDLLSDKGLSSAVGLSSIVPTRPGSAAADFEAKLDSFNAKTFLSSVEQMKGLGALTEAEGAKLTSAAGALNKSMSEDAFKKSLAEMKSGMENAKARLAARRSQSSLTAASDSGQQEVTTIEQFNALPSGAVYLEDGVQYRKP